MKNKILFCLMGLISNLWAFENSMAQNQIPQDPMNIDYPNPYFQSLQEAVDFAADGATIRLAPGDYNEQIRVHSKRMNVMGASNANAFTRLKAPLQSGSVISLSGTASLRLSHLRIEGGEVGIASGFDPSPQKPSLVLQRVTIGNSGRGIFGAFQEISAERSKIEGNRIHGLSILGAHRLIFRHLEVLNNGQVGILVLNQSAPAPGNPAWTFFRTTVTGNRGGGIEVLGGVAPVLIDKSLILENGVAGVTFHGVATSRITQTFIMRSSSDASGLWGDGFRSFASSSEIKDSILSENRRAGLSAFGCSSDGRLTRIRLSDNELKANGFDMEVGQLSDCAGSTLAWLEDAGGNVCRDVPISAPERACRALSSTLSPVDKVSEP